MYLFAFVELIIIIIFFRIFHLIFWYAFSFILRSIIKDTNEENLRAKFLLVSRLDS